MDNTNLTGILGNTFRGCLCLTLYLQLPLCVLSAAVCRQIGSIVINLCSRRTSCKNLLARKQCHKHHTNLLHRYISFVLYSVLPYTFSMLMRKSPFSFYTTIIIPSLFSRKSIKGNEPHISGIFSNVFFLKRQLYKQHPDFQIPRCSPRLHSYR